MQEYLREIPAIDPRPPLTADGPTLRLPLATAVTPRHALTAALRVVTRLLVRTQRLAPLEVAVLMAGALADSTGEVEAELTAVAVVFTVAEAAEVTRAAATTNCSSPGPLWLFAGRAFSTRVLFASVLLVSATP